MNIKLSDTSPLELPTRVEEQFRPTTSEDMVLHWPEYEAWETVEALSRQTGHDNAQGRVAKARLDQRF